jgi:hypothetical protein
MRHQSSCGPAEPISRSEAAPFIRQHEHLGTVRHARIFFGLRAPGGRLLGVVGFGHGAHAAGRGADAVLERGACVPGAPRNAASFLIGRALRYCRRVLGWSNVRAYSDPRFGEEGLVYRAAGFRRVPAVQARRDVPLWPGVGRPGAERPRAVSAVRQSCRRTSSGRCDRPATGTRRLAVGRSVLEGVSGERCTG